MGNRNAKRMAEQRRDRKPVSQSANHAGFSEGHKKAPMRVDRPLKMDAQHKKNGHQRQQGGCDTAHLLELRIAPIIALPLCLIKLADRFYHIANRLAPEKGKVTLQVAVRRGRGRGYRAFDCRRRGHCHHLLADKSAGSSAARDRRVFRRHLRG